jgi:hypothetical protein
MPTSHRSLIMTRREIDGIAARVRDLCGSDATGSGRCQLRGDGRAYGGAGCESPGRRASYCDFLSGVPSAPAALVIEGDPGIGNTTLWLGALDRARERGSTVLASRAAEAESVLAYAALADLLSDVDESVWADLPAPQQQSLDAADASATRAQPQSVRHSKRSTISAARSGLTARKPNWHAANRAGNEAKG